jgi:alkaline phosphatase D
MKTHEPYLSPEAQAVRKNKIMKNTSLPLYLFFILCITFDGFAQKSLLQSGPMLGYSDMLETLLWVQTNAKAKVQIVYWQKGAPAQKFQTEAKTTNKEEAFTAHLLADQVTPGNVYEYELRINDQAVKLDYPATFQTQALWQYRTEPPAFKVALGSCAYVNEERFDRPGNPYGGDYHIFKSIHDQRPDLMIWLGDNMYLREPDWYTRTGFFHRYTSARSLPELQPLLASTHHYAIWDDHDFGPNDSDRSYVHKDLAVEAFKRFWANPSYGLPGQGGITTFFQWNDVDFFLLDDRYFRSPDRRKTGDQTMLGLAQLEWLIDALTTSNATFKVVANGGQVLTTYAGHETYINLYPEERAYLLRRIEEEGIKNVVILSGDRHHSELSKLVNANGHSVYDFTVSPLTSGPHTTEEANALRMEGTLVMQRNFGVMEFSGARNERMLTMRIFDSNGKELWKREVRAE